MSENNILTTIFFRKSKSLKVLLVTVVIAIVVFLTVILIVVSYNAAYTAVENSYINQIKNINDGLNFTMKSYFEQQMQIADLYGSKNSVRDAILSGDYSKVTKEMQSFLKKHSEKYENI
ncbi:MAG: hypothetical protein N2316_13425, partial [Spirochaetes bacterium]|nr:hypothetical protein [Spirochaetota bacterium]